MLIALLCSSVLAAASQQKSDSSTIANRAGKPRVAIFVKTGAEYKWSEDLASTAIEDKLADNGFSLVQRKDLQTVLGELELTVNSLFDSKEGAKLGKQVAARFLVLGKVVDINEKSRFGPMPVPGSPSSLEVSIQMQVVNCETSDIIFTRTYKEKSKNKSVYNTKEENGKRNGAFLQAMGLILDKFVADTEELTHSGPLKAQSGSDDKLSVVLGESHGDTTKKPKGGNASNDDNLAAALADPKNDTSKKPKADGTAKPPAAKSAAPTAETMPSTPGAQSVIHGKVVDIDGKTVFLQISGARIGQVLEVYTKRRSIPNEKGDISTYYYSSADKCAVVRVTDLIENNTVAATVEQTFSPAGAADPKPRLDRIAKLHVVKGVN